jgi:hypothetical protein
MSVHGLGSGADGLGLLNDAVTRPADRLEKVAYAVLSVSKSISFVILFVIVFFRCRVRDRFKEQSRDYD